MKRLFFQVLTVLMVASHLGQVWQAEETPMSDNNAKPLTVELVTNLMNELARELGTMDPMMLEAPRLPQNFLCYCS